MSFDHQTRFWLAYDLLQAGNYDSSRLIFEEIQIFSDDAKCQLAYLYQMGLGGEQKIDQAISLYHAVISHGKVDVAYDLATLYLRLNKVEESIPFFEKASKQGNASASYWLSEIHSGYGGFQINQRHFSCFLELAEQQGHLIARKNLLNIQLKSSGSFLRKTRCKLKLFFVKAKIFTVLLKNSESGLVN